MHSFSKRFRAFTLIELLVVVAIIALLIAILLPSLGRAKNRAKVTACAANMKMIALATSAYASEWNDAVPTPFRHDNLTANSYYPYQAWFLYTGMPGNTNLKLYGPALLFAPRGGTAGAQSTSAAVYSGTGQINDARVFYCPSQTDPAFRFPDNGDRTADWLDSLRIQATAVNPANSNGKFGYLFVPHVQPTGTIRKYPYLKLSKTPKNISILTDLICGSYNIAHLSSSTQGTWNLAFSDGHVDAAKSSYVVTQLHTLDNNFASTGPKSPDIAGDTPINGKTNAFWDNFFTKITDDLERNSGNR